MKRYVVMDFETASGADLKKVGAWAYAENPTTEVLCLGYSVDGSQDVRVRRIAQLQNMSVAPGTVHAGELEMLAADLECIFIAHNVGFEKAIWRNIMVKQYSWPNIPNSRWHDSLAVCAMKGIPMKLEKAAQALRLANETGTDHRRLVTAPSKFDKRGQSQCTTDVLEKVYAENILDVRAETELNLRIGGLQPCERGVWLLDQRINERGVRVDLEFVRACQAIIDDATPPLLQRFREITGGINPGQTAAVVEWCHKQGVAIPNLQKETIAKLLGVQDEGEDDDGLYEEEFETPLFKLPTHVRDALDIRRKVGSSSIKKLAAIRNSACSDERVRGVVQYHGAGPGRWVGRLFQPQNFPRGTLKIFGRNSKGVIEEAPVDVALVVAALQTGDAKYVEALFGDPFEVVISGLRHAIVASPGRVLNVGDFATIEARIDLAIAGQHDKTALMEGGQDIYCDMASSIYKREIDKKRDPAERQTGKNSVLGLGFQMGWKKFKLRYAQNESDDFAKKVVETYRKEWAPKVPDLWAGLERAAIEAVWDHKTTEAYGIQFKHEDIWLTARLHSGRKLYYPYPLPVKKAMPWDETDIRRAWTCRASKNGRFITRDMYGGLLTENVVQATARDLLTTAMFKCEKENFPIVLTVHDEIVAEPLIEHSNKDMLEQIMCDRPQWAIDLQIPIGAECWAGERYRK